MAKITQLAEIGTEIMSALKSYTDEVKDNVDEAVTTATNNLKNRIEADSPKRTGFYSKGWQVKTLYRGHGNKRMIVHNKTSYQLTHLLEYGHAIKGGTARSPAHPHIKKNEEIARKEFQKQIEEALQ